MAVEVGGQMTQVPRRRSLIGADYLRLAVLLAAAAAIHVWLVVNTAVPARDSLGYARYALNLSDPSKGAKPDEPRSRMDVVHDAVHPPAYPVLVWLTEKALRGVADLPVPDRALLATQVSNSLAGILLVIPMYLLGRLLFGRDVGFAAALLFQVLPVPARVTSDGLSEGLYLLVTCGAVALGVRAVRRPAVGAFLLCGLATGAGYLVRPEGLMVGAAVGAVVVAGGLRRQARWDELFANLAALCVGGALVAVPYMLLIGKLTNKTTPQELFEAEPAPIWRGQDVGAKDAGAGAALFGAWWDPARDAGKNKAVWGLKAVSTEVIKSTHYGVGVFGLLGVVLLARRVFAPDPGVWVLLCLWGMNFLLLVFLAARVGYVSERHTVQLVMVVCVFAAAAIDPYSRFICSLPVVRPFMIWPRLFPAAVLVTLVALSLPFALKKLHPQREGHKHAGQWLAAHMGDRDHIIDPLKWAEWYAGHTLYRPVEFVGSPPNTWVVFENGKTSPHSRLPQWEDAKRRVAAEGAELVYSWPEKPSRDGFAVEVYRIRRPRGPAAPQPANSVPVPPQPGPPPPPKAP